MHPNQQANNNKAETAQCDTEDEVIFIFKHLQQLQQLINFKFKLFKSFSSRYSLMKIFIVVVVKFQGHIMKMTTKSRKFSISIIAQNIYTFFHL